MTTAGGHSLRRIICALCGRPAATRAANGLYHPGCQRKASYDRRQAKVREARKLRATGTKEAQP